MQFLMLVCLATEPVPSAADGTDNSVMEIEDWVSTMDGRGARLAGDVLAPEREAVTVRVRNGQVLVTDGPYLETKEILCGFDLLECASRDEAITIAAQHPMAADGVLELRQLMG